MAGSESKRKQGAAKRALAGRKKRKGAAEKFQNAQVRAVLDSQVHSVYTTKAVDDRRIPGPDLLDESMNGLTDVLRGL